MSVQDKKTVILNEVEKLVGSFLFYDRKGDEDLSSEDIKRAISTGEITADEIADYFRKELKEVLGMSQ